MSGGSGTRLWPLSTSERPKQFHTLFGEDAMIVETAKRFSADSHGLEFLAPVVIAGAAHGGLVNDQLRQAGVETGDVILEPQGRNTAAAAVVAALAVQAADPEAKVLLCPADHVVRDPGAFLSAVATAGRVVDEKIVTFGMTPTAPETGFGYIMQGEELAPGVFAIEAFREKPELEMAEAYLADGGYSWNSGVFFFSPDVMLREFAEQQPDILAGVRKAMDEGARTDAGLVLDAAAFGAVASLPVDIAIMEGTRHGAVAPCVIGWADVGSWSEYWRLSQKDDAGNAVQGSVLTQDVRNTLVRAEPGMHVSVAGVDDLIVVVTRDKVMVLPMDQAQSVKALIPED